MQYQISGERTLARAGDLAGAEYKMQPTLGGMNAAVAASAAPNAAPVATKAAAGNGPAPQIRFVTASRPDGEPAKVVAPSAPPTLLDRLWNRIVGVGVARAEGQ